MTLGLIVLLGLSLLLAWLFYTRGTVAVLFVFLFVQLAQGVVFILLGYDFLGLVQWLLYGGALAVLFVFARYLYPEQENEPGMPSWQIWLFRGVALTLALAFWIWLNPHAPELSGAAASIEEAGQLLMSTYLIPLELISIFLLAALVVALWLARTPGQVPDREGVSNGHSLHSDDPKGSPSL